MNMNDLSMPEQMNFLRLCAIRMDKEIWDGHAAQSQGSPFL